MNKPKTRWCGSCLHGKRDTKVSLPHCTKGSEVMSTWRVDEENRQYICGEWEERIYTNADALRHMTDEELHAEILRLQDIAAACPDCHRKTGAERLRTYLSMRAKT